MASVRHGSLPVTSVAAVALFLGVFFSTVVANADVPSADIGPVPRVVGGEKASAERHPWTVALVDRRYAGHREMVVCGGSLVAADWVITAEHCVRGMRKRNIAAIAGVARPSGNRAGRIGVRGIRYPSAALDVALLHLRSRSRERTIQISSREPAAGSVATALGWGALWFGGRTVDRLRRVDLEIRTQAECEAAYFGEFDPNTMLCAGGSGRDTCSGDSGGPLVQDGMLVGVTSFGRGCGQWPGVYMRVDELAPWVMKVVRRANLRRAKRKAARRGDQRRDRGLRGLATGPARLASTG